jgi:endonuclease G
MLLPAAQPEGMGVPVIFDGLEQREGYRADFLGFADGTLVPIPALTDLGLSVAAPLADGTVELKYHKFTVVMHRERRLAVLTASNVDWRSESRTVDGRIPSRRELTGLPDNTIEQWVTDSRIAPEHQLPDVFFTKDGGAFDKGHIVRRDDVCWGTTFQDIQMANGDTYHTTNCTPQIAGFNQSQRGVDNWGDLENLIQQQTNAEKAIVFAGPVLAPEDRHFHGRDENGLVRVAVPSRFWKIVLVSGSSGPEAFGFLLEQDLSRVPLDQEFVVPAPWRRFMRRISELEALLFGLADLSWLKARDRFDEPEAVRLREELRRTTTAAVRSA